MFAKTIALVTLASVATAIPYAPRDKTASTFHPVTDDSVCMGIKGGKYFNGALVDVYDCNGSRTQEWNFNGGQGQIFSVDDTGKAWCVDAGSNPAAGAQMKIWDCFDNLPQQQWSYNIDTRAVELSTGSLCLELPHGLRTSQNVLQINPCVDTPRWDDSDPTKQQWKLPDFWWWPF